MHRPLAHAALIVLALAGLDAAAQERAPAAPQDDVHAWLARMNRALEELNYRGTFVHDVEDTFETLSVVHRNQDGVVDERVWTREGVGREIVRRGNQVRAILPDQRAVLLEERENPTSLVSALPSGTVELEPNYELALGAADRVADRAAQIVAISPRDEFRYGYKLWLDQDTALPLRSQLIDASGNVVEEIRFTEIEIGVPIQARELEPAIDTRGFDELRPSPSTPIDESSRRRVGGLPSGFKLSTATRTSSGDPEALVEHYVFIDGLTTVSVFVTPSADAPRVPRGGSNHGSTSTFSASDGNVTIQAVGEVPPRTVRSIALSLTGQ